jgi:predicted nucleic acid-binding protein
VKPVLLDTGCMVALLDRSERHHAACVEAAESVKGPLVTCEAVIAESCYLLRDVTGAADAVLANVERGVFKIPFRLDAETPTVRALMTRYRKVPMDLADACLVALAGLLNSGSILTLDGDFRVYRWKGKQPFELVIPLP